MCAIEFSDDPREVQLTPYQIRAALGLLNWSLPYLAKSAGVPLDDLRGMVEFGQMRLMEPHQTVVLRLLLTKVSFSIAQGRPGVALKRGVIPDAGGLVCGGPQKRLPPL